MPLVERIREIIGKTLGTRHDFSSVSEADSLYDAGLNSHEAVSLMVALEESFGIEFPDHLISRGTFESVGAIARALKEMGA
jgi:acyl carrier protein